MKKNPEPHPFVVGKLPNMGPNYLIHQLVSQRKNKRMLKY